MVAEQVVERLLGSDEPSIRLKLRGALLGDPLDAEEVRSSARVRALPRAPLGATRKRPVAHASASSRRSLVGWGGVDKRRMNGWVTAEALVVLAAGRTSSRVSA